MILRPQMRFVYGLLAWMLVLIVVLTLLGEMALDLFFMITFASFFGLLELINPFSAHPEVRSRLRWVALFGMLVFGLILLERLLPVIEQV